jgi:PKD repeat protein
MKNLLYVFFLFLIMLSCSKEEEPITLSPVSSFTFTVDKIDYQKIQFQNASHSIISNSSFFWSFGDGETSIEENPVHTFNVNGIYSVTLKVTNGSLSDIFCKSITITDKPIDTTAAIPTVIFTYSQNARDIQFQNASTGLLSNATFGWNFGDGSVSDKENIAHTYNKDGLYNVVLKVNNNGKSYSYYKTLMVSLSQNPLYDTLRPIPMFKFSYNGKEVYFVNSSSFTTNQTIYKWNFGDGTESTNENPSHVFNDGIYNVVLKVSNGKFAVSYSAQVAVPFKDSNLINPIMKPDAYFVYSQQNASVFFQNASSNTTPSSTYYWTFGDGSSSFDENPFRTYAKSGIYNVVLKVTTENVSSSFNLTVNIP